jgi:hypothetical protein
VRLLTGLVLPEENSMNRKSIARGEHRKMLAEEPWRASCDWPLPCTCKDCQSAKEVKYEG